VRNASVAECLVTYNAPAVEKERKGGRMILRLKTIPWTRVIIDTLLVAGMLLASSSFLSVR